MENFRIGVVHTLFGLVDDVRNEIGKQFPQAELINIADDSLLSEALTYGRITPGVLNRICGYYKNLQDMGCACILNTCSTVGEAAETGAKLVSVPVLRIDAPMAAKAVELGRRIAVVATAASTIAPSCRLVESMAKKAGKEVLVTPYYVDGVYSSVRTSGSRAEHDRLVLEAAHSAAEKSDVVIFAQGSMHRLAAQAKDIKKPVLTSLESGVAQIRSAISA